MVDNSAELIARLEALEQRVLQLEHPSAVTPVPPIVVETKGKKALTSEEVPSLPTAGGTFPVLGKALLGMAGAYLLRAVADSGTIPKLVVVVLAILYAGGWLVGAARVRRDRIFASTTFAFTSALILAPMLWELTVRFEVFRPALSAGVLGAFAIAALALTWQKPFPAVLWVAYATSMLTSLVLMIAVEDLVPFVCAFLAISFVSEVAAILGHASNARTFAASSARLWRRGTAVHLLDAGECARRVWQCRRSGPGCAGVGSLPALFREHHAAERAERAPNHCA